MVNRRSGVVLGIGLGVAWLAVGLSGPAGAQKEDPPKDPDEFVTEIRLAVDRSKSDPRRLKGVDLQEVEKVLQRRLKLFGSTEGTVTAKSLEDLRMVVPTVKIDDLQLKVLCREGRVEVRHLDNIRTTANEDAPYGLDQRVVQGDATFRFRDLRSGGIVPTDVYLKRCPLVVDSDDIDPDMKADEAGAGGGFRVPLTPSGAKRMRKLASREGTLIAVVFDGELQGIRVIRKPPPPPKERKPEKKKGAEGLVPVAPSAPAAPSAPVAKGALAEDLGSYVDLFPSVSGPDEAAYMAVVLTSGALPGPLRVLSQRGTNRRSVAMAPLDKRLN